MRATHCLLEFDSDPLFAIVMLISVFFSFAQEMI